MSRGATDGDGDGTEAEALDPEENASRSQRRSSGRPGRLQIALRLIAPAAAALALVSVITDDTRLDDDIVLIAPARAHPGESIALRALVYAGLNKPQGPSLVHARTRVELKAPDSSVLASTELRPGHGPSHEGSLRLPSGKHAILTLVAKAWSGGEPVTVERPLALGGEREPAPLLPRALGPLQQLSLGALRERPDTFPPRALTIRVAGGACVPEEPCELLVYADPPATIEALATPSATVERGPRATATALTAVRVTTHGPEADLSVRISGEVAFENMPPQPIAAARAVRLPVAMGADAMRLERAVLNAGESFEAALIGRDARAIVDVFGDAGWLHSVTQHGAALASPALPPGLYRVQLRRDPFDSASAAVRSIYVRRKAETDLDALLALARRVLEREREQQADALDPLAERLVRDSSAANVLDFDTASRYLLAALDDGTYRLPPPVSGYPLARKRALAHREDVRTLALVVVALAALSLVLLLMQRGLLASEQAALLLRASGTEHKRVRKAQLRMTLRVAGSALSVALIFCAIALYLIIRGRVS
jgi:hypothetical protein